MDRYFSDRLKDSVSIPDIFELVKEVVWKSVGKSRAGLDLGLIDAGNSPQGFLGGFYISGSNIIIMNETPLKRIQETNPNLLTPYIFSVLMHEYLHSLGMFDEEKVRKLTYEICSESFSDRNVVTQISKDIKKFFPNFIYPDGAPQVEGAVKLVPDFDRSSIRYIG
jgi:hypothetical protein